jgi:hypothetical protein
MSPTARLTIGKVAQRLRRFRRVKPSTLQRVKVGKFEGGGIAIGPTGDDRLNHSIAMVFIAMNRRRSCSGSSLKPYCS